MEKLNFEIGQWVSTEDGYGQIMYIRAFYIEDYENNRNERKNGTFKRFLYICKLLCKFDGKIKSSNRIKVFSSISPIDKEGLTIVKDIKTNKNEDYLKYILYEDKISLDYQLFVEYKLDETDYDFDLIKNQIKEISSRLYPSFSYKDFSRIFKEYNFPFSLNNIIGYGESNKNSLTLRFDSALYKTKDKEVIFDNVNVFFKD